MCSKCFADGTPFNGSEPVGTTITRRVACPRCSGTGFFIYGVCFKCNGARTFPVKAKIYDASKLTASKARKAERDAAKAQAAAEALTKAISESKRAAFAAVPAAPLALMKAQLMLSSGQDLGIPSLKGRLEKLRSVVEDRREWSIKRAEFLVSLVDGINALEGKVRDQRKTEDELRADPTSWIRSGRIVIEGEVLSVKERFNDFGSVLKMLVSDDVGRKFWSSVPRGLDLREGDRGQRVRFTATVERSKDDPIFGFCSRPTKPEVLPQAEAA